jgi:hypothetical protein
MGLQGAHSQCRFGMLSIGDSLPDQSILRNIQSVYCTVEEWAVNLHDNVQHQVWHAAQGTGGATTIVDDDAPSWLYIHATERSPCR